MRKPLPSDLDILNAIYERHYDCFASYSDASPNRATKIYVPIDIIEIAKTLNVDPDIVFGRLYYHLDKKHRYKRENGAFVHLFAREVGGDRNCVNFPYLASLLAEMRDGIGVSRREEAMTGEALDPFRAVVGVISNSDTLTAVATAAGLRFDMRLTEREAYSHSTRVRALLPRIFAAYDTLSPRDQLIATRAVLRALGSAGNTSHRAIDALLKIGWEVRDDGDLVTANETVKERFFPKGSPWDAAVVIRGVFDEAKNDILIYDGYCDQSVFHLLGTRKDLTKLNVRIVCWEYAAKVAAEAKLFVAQYPGVTVEVRKPGKDFHDRFIVIDGKECVHLGASIKDAGVKGFMLNRVEDAENLKKLLDEIEASWNSAKAVV